MKGDRYYMTQQDNILLAKRNIVDCIYKEARLEGIAVTFPDTYEIYSGRTVAGLSVDDTVKINNLKHAWGFVLDTLSHPIDLRYIRQINSEIGKGIVFSEGVLRTAPVSIGGTTWRPTIPDEKEIGLFITDVVCSNKLSATDRAIRSMLYVMRSQLFYDGNKRTAQLLANKIMIENGAGIISVPVEHQHQFLSMLVSFYETGDQDDIYNFIYDNCIEGIDMKNDSGSR
ncbi:MAG: Fic family protein [Oscillospiraceae bacterium]|nr:Fic family protein [Oscillospiraceae bacterium]